LFVAAAPNEMLKSIIELSDAMQWSVQIIDIGEASQRNIQLALASDETGQVHGDVALFFSDERQVLLTVSAHQELYYSRRLELPEGLFSSAQLSSSTPLLMPPHDLEDDPLAQRFVADIQRSLDALRRTWPSISTENMQVYAAQRSKEVSAWLGPQLGLKVDALDVKTLFSGFEDIASAHQGLCLPLLGALLRTESHVL
jgi:MSHA biogenesis protein MshI